MTEQCKDWRCRIGWHGWVRRHNDPSSRSAAAFYLECRRCQKVRPLAAGNTQPYPIGDMDQGGI